MNMTEIKIRGYHLDGYGHVNNARYLEFLEEARWAGFESRVDKKRWDERKLSMFAVNININYRRPAKVGEVVAVHTAIRKFGNKSCTMSQKVVLKGTDTLVADADVTFVLADAKGKAVPIDEELREMVECLSDEPKSSARQ